MEIARPGGATGVHVVGRAVCRSRPLSVLDIQRIIGHLCERQIGVLITDHNVRETLGICDRAYILNEGRVIAEGDPGAILADQQVRRVYLGESFQL